MGFPYRTHRGFTSFACGSCLFRTTRCKPTSKRALFPINSTYLLRSDSNHEDPKTPSNCSTNENTDSIPLSHSKLYGDTNADTYIDTNVYPDPNIYSNDNFNSARIYHNSVPFLNAINYTNPHNFSNSDSKCDSTTRGRTWNSTGFMAYYYSSGCIVGNPGCLALYLPASKTGKRS